MNILSAFTSLKSHIMILDVAIGVYTHMIPMANEWN